jgi:hypothetical protein
VLVKYWCIHPVSRVLPTAAPTPFPLAAHSRRGLKPRPHPHSAHRHNTPRRAAWRGSRPSTQSSSTDRSSASRIKSSRLVIRMGSRSNLLRSERLTGPMLPTPFGGSMRLRCASRRRSASAGPSLTGEHWRPSDSNRSLSTFEPVSVPAREVRREKVRRGQRPRGHFWRHRPISGRQRPCYPASAAAKPRKVKNYSDRGRKPDLRGTAWWARQDSNLQPSGYERVGFTGKPNKYGHFCSCSGPLVHVWLRRSIGYSLVGIPHPSRWHGDRPAPTRRDGDHGPHPNITGSTNIPPARPGYPASGRGRGPTFTSMHRSPAPSAHQPGTSRTAGRSARV